MKINSTWVALTAAVALLLGALVWYSSTLPEDTDVITRSGLHWHPQIAIYVKGEQIEIPHNIGIGAAFQGKPGYGRGSMAMTPIHTHDDVPLIHLEFQGSVTEDDLKLGMFFEIWGKDMRSFGENMRMTVNEIENTDFENYVMQDGDKIELRYD